MPTMTTTTSLNFDPAKLRPVWGNVFVRPDDVAETDEVLKQAKAAGIYLDERTIDSEQRAQVEATIIAVGDDCFKTWANADNNPQPGDRVLINRHAGYVLGDKLHRLVSDTDIMAVIEE